MTTQHSSLLENNLQINPNRQNGADDLFSHEFEHERETEPTTLLPTSSENKNSKDDPQNSSTRGDRHQTNSNQTNSNHNPNNPVAENPNSFHDPLAHDPLHETVTTVTKPTTQVIFSSDDTHNYDETSNLSIEVTWGNLDNGYHPPYWFSDDDDDDYDHNDDDHDTVFSNFYDYLSFVSHPNHLNDPNLLYSLQNLWISAHQNFLFLDLTNGPDSIPLQPGIVAQFPAGIRALDGNDLVIGSLGTDVVNGNQGFDTLTGENGNDYLRGGRDHDILDGGPDNDLLNGNLGDDWIAGGPGNDYLRGGQGNDVLIGGEGDDILIGDFGFDILTGNSGTNYFILRASTSVGQLNPLIADQITHLGTVDEIGIADIPSLYVLKFESTDLNFDGATDTLIKIENTNEILGVVLNNLPSTVADSVFLVSPTDPVLSIG